MNKRSMYIGMFVGSTIGGFAPILWHGSLISISAVVLSGIGGLAGIWAAHRLGGG
jgi:hypothetical protein